MANISGKPPGGAPSIKIRNLNQLLVDNIMELELLSGEPITHIPEADVYSTPEELFIEVEMPGVRKDEIEVLLHKNTITVKALKYECYDENKVNYVCMERAFGRLYRTIEIPFPVDTARTRAVYKNGLLTIVVPRVEDKRQETKKIKVESS